MITSMTGFGRGSAEGQGGTIGVEVRSVNSRFLDIQVRSPQLLQAYEQAVRERVQKAVAREKSACIYLGKKALKALLYLS